jgi:hypothetical protein
MQGADVNSVRVFLRNRSLKPDLLPAFLWIQYCDCRSEWPRGLRHELSSLARTLGSWVRIPPKVLMSVCFCSVFVFVLSCVGSGLATGWSPIQGVLPTVLGLRNWSETKRFTDALCSKVWEKIKGEYCDSSAWAKWSGREAQTDLELVQKLRIHGSVPPRQYTFHTKSAQIKKESLHKLKRNYPYARLELLNRNTEISLLA